MSDTETDTLTPTDRYIRRLAAAVRSRDQALGGLRNWRPAGTVNVDVIRITADGDDEQWIAWAMAGKLFAHWHSGRSTINYGTPGSGLGHALRSLGPAGARGPSNPGAARLLNRLVAAGDDSQLAEVLGAIARELRSNDYPPRWATIATEIEAWRNPATRNETRVLWARQFHTYQPTTPASPTTDES